jgi:hypothetical protein
MLSAQQPAGGDWVVQRDGQVIQGEISRADEDGIHFSDQRVVAWEYVLACQTRAVDAAALERYRTEIGDPAARLRWRLEIGDVAGAVEAGRPLWETLASRTSETAVGLHAAQLADQLRKSDLPGATLSYLRIVDLLHPRPEWQQRLPPSLALPADIGEEIYERLLPMGLDRQAATELWPGVETLLQAKPLGEQPLSLLIYAADVAASSGRELGSELLGQLHDRSPVWFQVFEFRRLAVSGESIEPSRIEALWGQAEAWPDAARAVGWYWLAAPGLLESGNAFDLAAVRMLSIPAVHGDRFPELAAAAIVQVAKRAEELGDENTAEKLYNEIRRRYPQTHWGRTVPTDHSSPEHP